LNLSLEFDLERDCSALAPVVEARPGKSFVGGDCAEGLLKGGYAVQGFCFAGGVNESVNLLTHKQVVFPLLTRLFGSKLSPFIFGLVCCVGFHGLFFIRLFVSFIALRWKETASRGGQRE